MIIISHLIIIIIIILSSSSTSYPARTPYRSGNKNKKVSYKKCQYNMLQPIQNFFQIKRKKVKLALSGLHSSGKTTILYKLKLGEVVTTVPTIGFNIESVDISRRHSVTAWDIGGRCNMRPLARHYITGMDVLFFVVDSSQPSYMQMASAELAYYAKVCLDIRYLL